MAWLRQQSAPTTAGRAPLGPGVHRGFDSMSHLAVWPALYVVSSIPCLMQVAGIRPLPGLLAPVLGIAFLTGIATYLLDRAKLGGRWLDPADDAAHAARHAFITRHAGAIRLFIAASLCLATILAWRLPIASHWPAALPAASSLGVLVYASRPRSARPRPKDLLALKNLYVACGITGFALLLVAASMGLDAQDGVPILTGKSVVFAAIALLVRVWADAALCDLDDHEADRRFRTSTLATSFGHRSAWNIAFGVRLALAAALAVIPLGPAPARLSWAAATALSSISLRIASPAQVRDWVDVRFPLELLGVCIVLAMA